MCSKAEKHAKRRKMLFNNFEKISDQNISGRVYLKIVLTKTP